MYFYEKQVRQLLTRLADRFSGGEVWFDVCGPMMANSKYIKPDSLRGHEAQIRSGLKDGHEVENWATYRPGPLPEILSQKMGIRRKANRAIPGYLQEVQFAVGVQN